jgi:IrrE N-terminal-like domain
VSKPDDTVRDLAQLAAIRKHARRALEAAGALGRYPTAVIDVMDAAKLVAVDDDVLNEGFIAQIRRKALKTGGVLKTALSKVLGLFDVKARLVYIDRSIKAVKQTFLKLHETAHGVLTWQRDAYRLVEDCEKTISPEISEEFDREANAFASEVLFQLGDFTQQAADEPFGIRVPMKLSTKYGASIYASIRRYVSTSRRACAVVVTELPVISAGHGFTAMRRRIEPSPEFLRVFGEVEWPEQFTPDEAIGATIPVGGRRMSRPRSCGLRDQNGELHECVAEAFATPFQVFILVHEVATLNRTVST